MVAHAVPLSQDSGCSGAFWSGPRLVRRSPEIQWLLDGPCLG